MYSIVFFGSFQHYSAIALQKLVESPDIKINAVITTPPRPGDRGKLTKTAVQEFCESHNLPVYPLESLDSIPDAIQKPDFLVVCGYGKYIPLSWLQFPKVMPVNAHQSLLPDYAGRFPAQWAILRGEARTGVTLIKMTESFRDKGEILAQQDFPISAIDTAATLYTRLYELSAGLIIATLPQIAARAITPKPQVGEGFYARQITREDGFIDPASLDDPAFGATLDRMLRALNPWPGVWTYVKDLNGKKLILKIFSADIFGPKIELKNVQIEGKKSTFWTEISNYYFLKS